MANRETLVFTDDGSIEAAMVRCRDTDNGPLRFLVLGYEGENVIKLVGEGEGGLKECFDQGYLPLKECRYVLVRQDHKVEMASTVKFGYIDWAPDGVKPSRRAILSTHKGQMSDFMKPWHVTDMCTEPKELSDEEIRKKIMISAGTWVHETDKKAWTHQSKKHVDSKANKAAPANKPVAKAPVADKAYVKPAGPKAAPAGVAPANPSSALEGSGLKVEDQEGFDAALGALRNDESDVNYVVVSCATRGSLKVLSSGTGDVAAILSLFEAKEVNFALYRVTDVIDGHKTVKFVYIKWQPENVSPMKKAAITTKDNYISKIFEPNHVSFFIQETKELNEDMVMDKVGAASGSKSFVTGKASSGRIK